MTVRKILLAVCLLLATVAVQAQDARAEFEKDPRLSASNLLAYPGPRRHLVPAPEGYSPVYLSHYGRHGSRYLVDSMSYDRPYLVLAVADSLGKLTPRGRELLEKVRQIRLEAWKRWGELTQLGARQHKEIARRMAERFPQIFMDSVSVDARSTVVIRCILSMENALQQLLQLNPELRVTHDASGHDMYYMNQTDKELYDRKLSGGAKELLDSYYKKHQKYDHLMRVIFSDTAYVRGIDAADFARDLFRLAGNVQSTELRHSLDLYNYFTVDELYGHWLCYNAFWYITYGPSKINGGRQPFSQRNLLRKIIDEADSCLRLDRPGATLRYGHETMVMPLVCLLDLNGAGNPAIDIELLDSLGWHDYRIFPMGCNLQFVFYRRSAADRDVLVKVLLNEDEAVLPVHTDKAPYYRWSDVRDYYLSKLDGYDRERGREQVAGDRH